MRLDVLMAGIELRLWLPLLSKILPNSPVLARLRTAGDNDGLANLQCPKGRSRCGFCAPTAR